MEGIGFVDIHETSRLFDAFLLLVSFNSPNKLEKVRTRRSFGDSVSPRACVSIKPSP